MLFQLLHTKELGKVQKVVMEATNAKGQVDKVCQVPTSKLRRGKDLAKGSKQAWVSRTCGEGICWQGSSQGHYAGLDQYIRHCE